MRAHTNTQSTGQRFSSMTRTVVGGAACSEQMLKTFVEDYAVDVLHAWGMTGTTQFVGVWFLWGGWRVGCWVLWMHRGVGG